VKVVVVENGNREADEEGVSEPRGEKKKEGRDGRGAADGAKERRGEQEGHDTGEKKKNRRK
jgi:hypothetical protein